jgi:hypothetical protein
MIVGRRAFNLALLGAAPALALGACEERSANPASVYILLDLSGSYFRELDKALRTIRVMMGFIRAHDSFAVAEIGACSFTDEAVLLRFTAPDRPSERQRLVAGYAARLAEYGRTAKATNFTDIEEDLPPQCRRETPLPAALRGMSVIATNVTRLPEDNRDPGRYARRLDGWRKLVEAAGARWQVAPDPADVVALFKDKG